MKKRIRLLLLASVLLMGCGKKTEGPMNGTEESSKEKTEEISLDLPEGYESYWNYARKKGYSGTAVFTRHKPLSVVQGIGIEEYDMEGRVLTLEYDNFYLVTCYTPNSQSELARLSYRMEWEDAFRGYVKELDKKKPVIFCGDLNVAHKEIDLKNPKSNRRNAGFTDEERGCFGKILESGFVDSFRYFYPDLEAAIREANEKLAQIKIEDEVSDVVCVKLITAGYFFPVIDGFEPFVNRVDFPLGICGDPIYNRILIGIILNTGQIFIHITKVKEHFHHLRDGIVF